MTSKPAKKKATKSVKPGKVVKASKPAPAAKARPLKKPVPPAVVPKAAKAVPAPAVAKTAPKSSSPVAKSDKKPAAPKAASAPKAPARPVAVPPPAKLAKVLKLPKRPAEPKLPEPPAIPVKSSLTKKDLDQFRKLLQNKHRDFTEAYRTSKGDSRTDLSTGTEDYIDYAVSSYSKEFLLSLTEMDRRQLQLVQEALRRIDREEYGLCLQCGQEIPRKRLEVQPWARHCVRCQELEERGLLRPAAHPGDGEEYGEDSMLADDDFGGPAPARRAEEEDEEEEEEEDEAEEEEEDEIPAKIEPEGPPIIVVDEDEEVGEAGQDEEE